MVEVNDHVKFIDRDSPVGIIESINEGIAVVNWGTADRKTFRDEVRVDELEKVPYEVVSPDEVETRLVRKNIFEKEE